MLLLAEDPGSIQLTWVALGAALLFGAAGFGSGVLVGWIWWKKTAAHAEELKEINRELRQELEEVDSSFIGSRI